MSLKRNDQKGYNKFEDVSNECKKGAILSQLEKQKKEPNTNLLILIMILGGLAAIGLGFAILG